MDKLPTTYEFIKRFNLINNKNLGQNFIINESLTDKIVGGHDITDRVVVEIGPGPGCLTRSILKQKPRELILIEKDQRFNEIYAEFEEFFKIKITVINADCLTVDFAQFGEDISLISNLPYNISTQIYVNILSFYPNVKNMILMFQKEVAERIIAKSGDPFFARLAAITNIVGVAKKLFLVKPTAFLPPPKIMSMVIKFEKLNQHYPDVDMLKFQKFSAMLFAQKRKVLSNILKANNINICQISGDSLVKRPHQLSIDEIYQIYLTTYANL